MVDVIIPQDLWDDDSEGFISTWFVSNGESVEAGDLLAEVMNEKVASELLAPAAGKLVILAEQETPITKGQVVGKIEG